MIGSNLFSPALSLTLVKNEISKQLGKNVNAYQIFYKENGEPLQLFFIIENVKHPFDDKGKISAIIKQQLKTKIPDKNIDAFLIEYTKNKGEKPIIKAKIFYSDEHKKEYIETDF